MLLGFKRMFADFVREGSKRHTIRAGHRWKVGDRCDCFVDPRQSTMALLGRWPCVRVEDIRIEAWDDKRTGEHHAQLWLNGYTIAGDEADALAWRDGFRPSGMYLHGAFQMMMEFWRGRLPFDGQIIHWDYDQPQPEPQRAPRGKGLVWQTGRKG